jgi:hypothetical protein
MTDQTEQPDQPRTLFSPTVGWIAIVIGIVFLGLSLALSLLEHGRNASSAGSVGVIAFLTGLAILTKGKVWFDMSGMS